MRLHQQINAAHANLHELHVLGIVPGKLLHPFVSDLESIVEVIDDGHLAPVLQQAQDCVTACSMYLSLTEARVAVNEHLAARVGFPAYL